MSLTRWHITFGTYGTRLHGDARGTTDRWQNEFGQDTRGAHPFLVRYERATLNDEPVTLTLPQRLYIEEVIPTICVRGRWGFIECAAPPDHVHVVMDIPEQIHGEKARPWLKRWLSESLDRQWPGAPKRKDGMHWWADGGSNRAVRGHEYREVVINYVGLQRASGPRALGDIEPRV